MPSTHLQTLHGQLPVVQRPCLIGVDSSDGLSRRKGYRGTWDIGLRQAYRVHRQHPGLSDPPSTSPYCLVLLPQSHAYGLPVFQTIPRGDKLPGDRLVTLDLSHRGGRRDSVTCTITQSGYGFAFPAHGASAITAIRGLTEGIITNVAFLPTSHLVGEAI